MIDDIYGETVFEKDLLADKDILSLVLDETFAEKLYASLCNMMWVKDTEVFAASFRYAGGVVAFLRNQNKHLLHREEDYLDFYLSGSEGVVFPEVKEALARLGWSPKPYDNN